MDVTHSSTMNLDIVFRFITLKRVTPTQNLSYFRTEIVLSISLLVIFSGAHGSNSS